MTGLVGKQEQNGPGDFVGCGDLGQRNAQTPAGGISCDDGLARTAQRPHGPLHGGVGGAGRDDVHADAVRCQFQSQAAGELGGGGFRCGIGGHAGAWCGGGVGTDDGDGPGAAFAQAAGDGTADVKDAGGVDVKAARPLGVLQVDDVAHFENTGDTGQAVERPQGGLGPGDDLFDPGGVAHVEGRGPQACGQIGDVGGEWIAIAVTPAQRWYRVYRKDGTLWFGAAKNNTATAWDDIDTGIAGFRPKITVAPGKTPQVWMDYEAVIGGPIVSRYTVDEGATWTLAGTVTASGKWPAIEIAHDGRRLHYWYDGGTIKGSVYDAQGNLILGPSAIVTGADDDAIDVRSVSHARGDWLIHLTYRSGGAIMDLNSTDGVTFT